MIYENIMQTIGKTPIVKLKNLTDELYATTSRSDNGGVFLGDARSFEFGINYKF